MVRGELLYIHIGPAANQERILLSLETNKRNPSEPLGFKDYIRKSGEAQLS